ncbi:MAG: Ig-like domain-containing protein, partial [Spirochaetaceae bacterium]|nr:Ig-like domain-containing protein [Spirochaetaceae bacterium]
MKNHYLVLFILFIILGCENILNIGHLEIDEYTPNTELVENILEYNYVSISFVQKPDKVKTEKAFSLTANGEEISGDFLWFNSKTLRFFPEMGFQVYTQYECLLSTDAEDEYGNSLEKPLEFKFCSSDDRIRPQITSLEPEYLALFLDRYQPVVVNFNESINVTSFLNSADFSPNIQGNWSWDENWTLFTFSPLEPFEYNTEYTLAIKTTLSDLNNNNLASQQDHRITLGGDTVLPELTGFGTQVSTIPNYTDYMTISNWEKNNEIHLDFSEPVNQDTIKTGITI